MGNKRHQPPPRRLSERIGRAVDDLLMDLAPQWGSRRKARRIALDLAEKRAARLSADWDASDDNRTRGNRWLTSRLSIESALEENLDSLRDRSRDEAKKDAFACGAIESAVVQEVGEELRPQSRIVEVEGLITPDEAQRYNDELEDVYRRWALYAFGDGTSMAEGQQLVCRTWKTDGDAFVLFGGKGKADKPVPLALHLIDSARVAEPPQLVGRGSARLGIEADDDGQPLRYWVQRGTPGDARDYDQTFAPLDAAAVCHIFTRLRIGQRRGIPWLTPALQTLKDLKDLRDYELIKRQIAACFSVFITTPDAGAAAEYRGSGETSASGYELEELEPGRIEYVKQGGAEVNFAAPTHDNSNFGVFLEGMLRAVAAALNFPYELLAKDYSRTTYSSGRLSLIDGRITFRCHQRLLVDRWLSRVWHELVRQAVAVGETSIDPRTFSAHQAVFLRHGWVAAGWPWIDPVKEVQAAKLAIECNLSTLTDELVAQGRDPEEQAYKRRREIDTYAAQRINIQPVIQGVQPPADGDQEDEQEEGSGRKKAEVAA